MRHLLAILGVIGAILFGARSFAVQPAGQAVSAKRQMIECMSKRMSANRTLTYNAALQACKDKLRAQKAELASNASIESPSIKTR
jgi:hypothetical protein